MFPGSFVQIGGHQATRRVLEVNGTSYAEDAWRERTDQVFSWLTEGNLDMVALYFQDVRTIS